MTNKNEIIEKRNFVKETIRLCRDIEGAFLELGKRLKTIRDDRLFEADYDSFEDFLWETKISPGTASRMIQVYDFYVVQSSVPKDKLVELGWAKLYTLLPIVKDKTKKEIVESLEEFAPLARHHLEDRVKEEKAGKDHKHEWIEIHIRQCAKCGVREKIYDK